MKSIYSKVRVGENSLYGIYRTAIQGQAQIHIYQLFLDTTVLPYELKPNLQFAGEFDFVGDNYHYILHGETYYYINSHSDVLTRLDLPKCSKVLDHNAVLDELGQLCIKSDNSGIWHTFPQFREGVEVSENWVLWQNSLWSIQDNKTTFICSNVLSCVYPYYIKHNGEFYWYNERIGCNTNMEFEYNGYSFYVFDGKLVRCWSGNIKKILRFRRVNGETDSATYTVHNSGEVFRDGERIANSPRITDFADDFLIDDSGAIWNVEFDRLERLNIIIYKPTVYAKNARNCA
jgi:hypothetical protein